MKALFRFFINGLLAMIPIVLTFYIIVWLIQIFESFFSRLILFFIPAKYYIPGTGIVIGISLIFVFGLLIQTWGVRTLYRAGEHLLQRFPIVGDIYSTLKDFIDYLFATKKEDKDQVVILEFNGYRFLGIVTRDQFKDAPKGIAEEGMIAVYIPMSYQIGGFTIYTAKENVTPIQMSKKDAMQWCLTAGIMKKSKTKTIH